MVFSYRIIPPWRLINSFLLFAGLSLPWLNQTSFASLVHSTRIWISLQNDLSFIILATALTLLTLFCVLVYPLMNLAALFAGRSPVLLLGLKVSLEVQALFLLLTPVLLSWIIQFQRIPILSWGYWISLAGLVSSSILEACIARRIVDRSNKRSVVFHLITGICLLLLFLSVTNTLIFQNRAKTFPTALVGVVLIDGTGSDLLHNALILVKDGIISYAGPRNGETIPSGYRVFDLGGRYVLPGLVNAHVHQTYIPSNLEKWAWAGVTSVCDLGVPVNFPFHLGRELLKPYPNLARQGAAGPILTSSGGYPAAEHDLSSLMVVSAKDASRKTGLLLELGPDTVKIALESRYGESLPLEHATEAVEAAHQKGIPVAVHLGNITDLEKALLLNVDSLHHMIHEDIPDITIQEMVDQEVLWVPTMEVMYYFFGDKGTGNVTKYIQASGKLALGNDAGYFLGLQMGLPYREMELLSEAGLPLKELITAATLNAAQVCRLEKQTGAIEIGRSADLIVLDENPLKSIQAFKKIKMVMLAGQVIRNDLQ